MVYINSIIDKSIVATVIHEKSCNIMSRGDLHLIYLTDKDTLKIIRFAHFEPSKHL